MRIIDSQFVKGRQSVELIEYLSWDPTGGNTLKFKLSIKSDSYMFQSYARIKRWTGDEWKELYSIHYNDMNTPEGMIYQKGKNCSKQHMMEDRNRLIQKAMQLLS